MEKTTQTSEQQWKGAVEALLSSTPATAAWPHLASFCALNQYLSVVDVCERVAGDDGRPGCIRYVASRAAPGPEEDDHEAPEAAIATWAREELLELDDAARRLSYAVVGSNMGFGHYVATLTVFEEPETEPEPVGCKLVWEFECEPVQGWSRDGLIGYLEAAVKGMATRIAAAAASDD